jgi:hypothetical protein
MLETPLLLTLLLTIPNWSTQLKDQSSASSPPHQDQSSELKLNVTLLHLAHALDATSTLKSDL